jgi:hypothetical protein
MARQLNARIDALFVEGPDDGAMVNAFVERHTKIKLAERPHLVKTNQKGGGDAWALGEFKRHIATCHREARAGVIVDRDRETNDKWPQVRAMLAGMGASAAEQPPPEGAIVNGRFGIWMWPDNVRHGDLETFVSEILPVSAALAYATEACRVAKVTHGAEYDPNHERKAALKVRSVWCDASAAGGYGHLVRNLPLVATPGSDAFLAWFKALFLT